MPFNFNYDNQEKVKFNKCKNNLVKELNIINLLKM